MSVALHHDGVVHDRARAMIRSGTPIVEAWDRRRHRMQAPTKGRIVVDDDNEATTRLAFLEAQIKGLKKSNADELSELKLARAVAALADLTDTAAPDDGSAVFMTAWKRTEHCHHFWGPTVGPERFCTKCQVPHSAAASEEVAAPSRRRS